MSSVYYSDPWVSLYHGDCLEITEWLAADVLVTDPPYGVSWQAHGVSGTLSDRRAANIKRSDGHTSIKGDYSPGVRDAALAVWGRRPALVFGTWRVQRPKGTRQRLIWHKVKTYAAVRKHPWFAADEEIYVLGSGFHRASVIEYLRDPQNDGGEPWTGCRGRSPHAEASRAHGGAHHQVPARRHR